MAMRACTARKREMAVNSPSAPPSDASNKRAEGAGERPGIVCVEVADNEDAGLRGVIERRGKGGANGGRRKMGGAGAGFCSWAQAASASAPSPKANPSRKVAEVISMPWAGLAMVSMKASVGSSICERNATSLSPSALRSRRRNWT